MNKIFTVLFVSVVLSFVCLPASAKTAQQEKMVTCNQEATSKTLKGDERKAFMKSCLSAKPEASAATPQQAMTACNKAATGKKGDERKQFMSACLKAKGPENMK